MDSKTVQKPVDKQKITGRRRNGKKDKESTAEVVAQVDDSAKDVAVTVAEGVAETTDKVPAVTVDAVPAETPAEVELKNPFDTVVEVKTEVVADSVTVIPKKIEWRRGVITPNAFGRFKEMLYDVDSTFLPAQTVQTGINCPEDFEHLFKNPMFLDYADEISRFGLALKMPRRRMDRSEFELEYSVFEDRDLKVDHVVGDLSKVKVSQTSSLPVYTIDPGDFGATSLRPFDHSAKSYAILSADHAGDFASVSSLYAATMIPATEMLVIYRQIFSTQFAIVEAETEHDFSSGEETTLRLPAYDRFVYTHIVHRERRLRKYVGAVSALVRGHAIGGPFIAASRASMTFPFVACNASMAVLSKTRTANSEQMRELMAVDSVLGAQFAVRMIALTGDMSSFCEIQCQAFRTPILNVLGIFFILALVPNAHFLSLDMVAVNLGVLLGDTALGNMLINILQGRPVGLQNQVQAAVCALWRAVLNGNRWQNYESNISCLRRASYLAPANLGPFDRHGVEAVAYDDTFVTRVWEPFRILIQQICAGLGRIFPAGFTLPDQVLGRNVGYSFVYAWLRGLRQYYFDPTVLPAMRGGIRNNRVLFSTTEVFSFLINGIGDVVNTDNSLLYHLPRYDASSFTIESFIDSMRPFWLVELYMCVTQWVDDFNLSTPDKNLLIDYFCSRITTAPLDKLWPAREYVRQYSAHLDFTWFFDAVVTPYRLRLSTPVTFPITNGFGFTERTHAFDNDYYQVRMTQPLQRYSLITAEEAYAHMGSGTLDARTIAILEQSQRVRPIRDGLAYVSLDSWFSVLTRWSIDCVNDAVSGFVSASNPKLEIAFDGAHKVFRPIALKTAIQVRRGAVSRTVQPVVPGVSPIARVRCLGVAPMFTCYVEVADTIFDNTHVATPSATCLLHCLHFDFFVPKTGYSTVSSIPTLR